MSKSKCNKWINLILSIVLLISSMFIFSSSRGCLSPYVENITVVTTEDFILIDYENSIIRNVNKTIQVEREGKKPIYFYDLSEQGKQKKNIILPKIVNKKILSFTSKLPWCEEYPCEEFEPWISFKSDKLEKLYIEFKVYLENSQLDMFEKDNLPKLNKIITNINLLPRNFIGYFNLKSYYELYKYYEENKEFIDQQIQKGYFDHLYKGIYACLFPQIRLANMQFMYNYDNAENDGYYWIDDINNGEKIEIIPENPIREGYTFGGWYNEQECVTEFDFNQIFNKSAIDEFTEYPENYVTFAYAKWIEI